MKIINIIISLFVILLNTIIFHQYINQIYYQPYEKLFNNQSHNYIAFDFENNIPDTIICGEVNLLECFKQINLHLTKYNFANNSDDHKIIIKSISNNDITTPNFDKLLILNIILLIIITLYIINIKILQIKNINQYNIIITTLYITTIIILESLIYYYIYDISIITNFRFKNGARIYGVDYLLNKITDYIPCNGIDCFQIIDIKFELQNNFTNKSTEKVEWIVIDNIEQYDINININILSLFPLINIVSLINIIYLFHYKNNRRNNYQKIL